MQKPTFDENFKSLAKQRLDANVEHYKTLVYWWLECKLHTILEIDLEIS